MRISRGVCFTPAPTFPTTTTTTTTTAAPWTPSSLGPVAWIDPSDSSSYTRSGSTLLSVTDKSGTYNTININGSPKTNYNYLNGINVFGPFEDYNNDYLQSSTYENQVSNGNHFALGVFKYRNTSNARQSLWSYETDQSPKRDYAVSSGATNNTWPGELDLDGSIGSNNKISSTIGNIQEWDLQSLTRFEWHIVACWFNKTGNQIGIRVDGQNAFTPVNDYDKSLQTRQELRLMRNRSSVSLDGWMGEYMAFASIPGTSGTDMSHLEKAEGYLAHKWGLTGNLPSNHPYKNTPPTT